ncbi:MAG: shikimate kinase [Bacteroidetes bacterium]|nr:shikimate kinase [Bacteroidota bacterium]
MKIVLLGYMGSGKSTVGKRLSEVLGYQFLDLDEVIEKQEGMSISKLFSEKGEIYFRKKEVSTLTHLLSEDANMVLALGGGTPCYGTVLEDLQKNQDTQTVYLKNSLETLTHRLFAEKERRPLIAHLETEDLLNDFIRKHLFERAFYYNQAQVILNGDAKNPQAIVEELVAQLF